MATDLTQESVQRFLTSNGGRVRNSELLNHYKGFLRENESKAQNRELFKKFVNFLATVRQEDGVSYVVLRKKFRGRTGAIGDIPTQKSHAEKNEEVTHGTRDSSPQTAQSRNHDRLQVQVETKSDLKQQHDLHVSKYETSETILPAAGIVNCNNNNVTVKPVKNLTPDGCDQVFASTDNSNVSCTLQPSSSHSDSKRSSGSGQSFEQTWDSKEQVELSDVQHNGVYIATSCSGQTREADGCSQSHCLPPKEHPHHEIKVSPPEVRTQTPAPDITFGPVHRSQESGVARVWALNPSLAQSGRVSSSTPCILSSATAPHGQANAQVSRSNWSLSRPEQEHGDVRLQPQEVVYRKTTDPPSPQTQPQSLPSKMSFPPADSGYLQHYAPPVGLSSSQDSLHVPAYPESPGWPQGLSSRKEWSSSDGLNDQTLPGGRGNCVHEALRRSQLTSETQPTARRVAPWHHSTGHLDDEDSRSESPPAESRLGPMARRMSRRLRSRLCRSLGADLDQAFAEEGLSPRQSRLQRLSSSLGVIRPLLTTSRTSSSRALSASPSSTKSLCSTGHESAYTPRHAPVPLEPKEHEWFMMAASGTWSEIYSLFRDEPGLLTKRDFISGYTVLHWIAKHGDHRVLNTLWYGVNKSSMTLEVDARSTCGYTPLHLAAIHRHKKLARLLVHKFKADVTLRDNSGKKPWQYLGDNGPRDLLELLGAPRSRIVKGAAAAGRQRKSSPSAAAEKSAKRPVTAAAAVKRHSSFAAIFKHKSVPRLTLNSESFV